MTPARPTMLTQAAQLLAEGQATSRELTDACLAAIDAHDQELRAFITVEHDTARSTADACDARRAEGAPPRLLDGLPVAVKDNLDVAGRVTTMGSEIFRDHVPTGSAAVVDRLEEHGAVRLGATNLHEFALGVTTENPHHGICRNPWDTSRTPGGSSGGSAVAVASGMALAALGTDTSGSIRIPAAACGIVGLKPTYGRISSVGCYPEAWSLDHVGVLTSSVADAALLLDALSGHDPRGPSSLPLPPTTSRQELDDPRPLRIGVEEEFFFAGIDPAVEGIVREALEGLTRAGATLVPISLPSLSDAVFALTVIDTAETTAFHEAQLRRHGELYGEDVRRLVECGALATAVDYVRAQQIRSLVRAEFARAFADVDVIASPTLPIRTPRIGETSVEVGGVTRDRDAELMRLVGPSNLAGIPSVSVPCGMLDGMPVGLQLIGPALGEGAVLRAAAAVESLVPPRLTPTPSSPTSPPPRR